VVLRCVFDVFGIEMLGHDMFVVCNYHVLCAGLHIPSSALEQPCDSGDDGKADHCSPCGNSASSLRAKGRMFHWDRRLRSQGRKRRGSERCSRNA
jgi:hypothetical protein